MWYILADLRGGQTIMSDPYRTRREAERENARLARVWRTVRGIKVSGSARKGYLLVNTLADDAQCNMYVGRK